MAASKTPIATDSAAELHDLIGDDATATFESDPKFIDSDPTDNASSENIEVQRDTDDTEDSEEEEDELEDEEEDELEDEDDVDEEDEDEEDEDEDIDDDDDDEDEEEEDDEEEVGAAAFQAAGLTSVRGSVEGVPSALEPALEEDDDAGDESELQDEYVIEGGGGDEDGDDSAETDHAIDAALRMSALVAVAAEFAANV
jgi:hypothetical protein